MHSIPSRKPGVLIVANAGIGILKRFRRDNRAYAMVTFALALVPFLGLVGLVIDLSEYETVNTELQDIADASALAGARELDGASDAITRATSAAVNFVTSDPRFASGTSAVQVLATPVFYSDANCLVVTTTPQSAGCIRVTTQTRSVTMTFARAIGVANSLSTQASATAESQFIACAVQPLMLCTPFASTNLDLYLTRGQMIRLKPKSGNGNLVAGDFGLLDPPGFTTGSSTLTARNIASSSPNFCYVNKLSVRTGSTTSAVNNGTQGRFDIPTGDSVIDALPPAPNVIKGMLPDSKKPPPCVTKVNNPTTTGTVPLPRDTCLPPPGSAASATGTCPASTSNLLIGNGDWSSRAATYWADHHSSSTIPANLGKPGGLTRYDLWKQETGCTDTSCTGTPATGFAFTGTEKPAPQCFSTAAGGPERRIIYVAVVNCSTQVTGNGTQASLAGSQLAKFFLTEPSTSGEIYAEYVDMESDSSGGAKLLHHIVQLVR